MMHTEREPLGHLSCLRAIPQQVAEQLVQTHSKL